jgi:4-amino-4-deoxy-L-arabinose transferase-like glycosyltransferase
MNGSSYEKASKVGKGEWIGLAAVAGVCLGFRLGGVAMIGKDEPRYAEVAREMVASGDWITPHLIGHTWFEKPALPYWLMAAAFKLFGVSELSARLGSALLAALAVAVVFFVGRRAGGERRGLTAALVLSSSALWLAFARGASFDMPLAATMTAALGSFYFFDVARNPRERFGWAAAAGAWAGASMLAKGLAGPLLLGLIVGAYLLVTWSWRRLRPAEVLLAAGAALAVASVWYVPVYMKNGWPFVEEFFVQHHFARYLTNKYHHPQPIWFYPVVMLGGMMPWTLLMLAGAPSLWRARRRRAETEDERLTLLALLWTAVPLLFFSLSESKLPGYILPIFPALAVLAAKSIQHMRRDGEGKWSIPVTAVALVGLGGGLAIYAARTLGAPIWEIALLLVPVAIGAAVVFFAAREGRLGAVMWGVGAWSAAVVALIAVFYFAELGNRESLRDVSQVAERELRPGERVLLFNAVEYSPAFYTQGRMVVDEAGEILIATSFDELAAAIDGSPTLSTLCVIDAKTADQLSSDGRFAADRLAEQRGRVLLRITRR